MIDRVDLCQNPSDPDTGDGFACVRRHLGIVAPEFNGGFEINKRHVERWETCVAVRIQTQPPNSKKDERV